MQEAIWGHFSIVCANMRKKRNNPPVDHPEISGDKAGRVAGLRARMVAPAWEAARRAGIRGGAVEGPGFAPTGPARAGSKERRMRPEDATAGPVGASERTGGAMRSTESDPAGSTPEREPVAVATVGRGEAEVRIEVRQWEGRDYLDIRLWEPGDGGELHATRKGITLRPAEILIVARALRKAGVILADRDEGRRRGAVPPVPAAGRFGFDECGN